MVGRFISQNRQKNTPSVRFGNISVISSEPIQNKETREWQESIIVEARSIKGYSGSPVFVIQNPYLYHPKYGGVNINQRGPYLLGISWGYNELSIEADILDKKTHKRINKTMLMLYPNTGMMNIVPVWTLVDFLNSDKVKAQQRSAEEIAMKSGSERSVPSSSAETDVNPSTQKKPFTRGDFMRDLNKVVRKKSRGKKKE